ncbi:MAG: hypothetical protein IT457_17360 [Planctomycetes bacterium]|nr:hypothetical protein [Planctomycetota bacterium]
MRRLASVLGVLLASAAVFVSALGAQVVLEPPREIEPREKDAPRFAPPDPWLEGQDEAKAFAKLGYERVGRMSFGDGHDTPRIQEDLGKLPLIFIETAHFRLCCNLPAQDLPKEKADRARLQKELERLGAKLPRLRPKALRELDPWLRAHLFAQRLEELYAEVATLLDVRDEQFPPASETFYFRGDAPPRWQDPWLGRGPYLGNKGKFLVLLFAKSSSCGRYLSTFTKAKPDAPSRWYFEGCDSFVFATAVDFGEGAFRTDLAMHAHVTHNLVHCLLDAYKGYSYVVPVWWKEGLAHWFRRRLSDEHNNFEAIKDQEKRAYTVFDWDERVRMRASHGLVRPLREIWESEQCTDFDLVDHMACWSRIEFLLEAFPRARMAEFLGAQKGFVDQRGNPPTRESLLARQRESLQAAFELDPDTLDAQWQAWLKKPKRAR